MTWRNSNPQCHLCPLESSKATDSINTSEEFEWQWLNKSYLSIVWSKSWCLPHRVVLKRPRQGMWQVASSLSFSTVLIKYLLWMLSSWLHSPFYCNVYCLPWLIIFVCVASVPSLMGNSKREGDILENACWWVEKSHYVIAPRKDEW